MRGTSPQAHHATNSPTKQPRAAGHGSSLRHRLSRLRQSSARRGFTIVELLIVVVVIAILAAITLVAYNGITVNARESALKADLNTTAKKVGIAQAETGSYPSVKPSGLPDTIQYSQTNAGQGFCATASKDGRAFHITESGGIQSGACSGHTVAGGGGGGGGTEIAANSPIQNVTSAQCQALPTFTGNNSSAVRMVTDNRGGTTRTYEIAKLADGKCWMLTNLKLGSTSDSITLTPADSNVASNFTLPQLTTGGDAENDLPRAYGPVPGDTGSGATNYGYLYNFAAATAGETTTSLTTGNAQHSICPTNWRLPSGGAETYDDEGNHRPGTGDFADLDRVFGGAGHYSEGGPSQSAWMFEGVFKSTYHGIWLGGLAFLHQGNDGYAAAFWTSTTTASSYGAALGSFGSSYTAPDGSGNRNNGWAIRCLLN